MLESTPIDAVSLTVLKKRTVFCLKSWRIPHPAMGPKIDALRLPTRVGTTAPGPLRALCVGPDEWLLVCDAVGGDEQRARIEVQAAQQHLAMVELSQGYAVVNVRGPACREVLAKGCGLDLHPRAFREDTCARTLLAHLFVTLDCRGLEGFDIYVGRSFQWQLHSWLVDASIEYDT
jgi:sarcosine oxidase subunit gamma